MAEASQETDVGKPFNRLDHTSSCHIQGKTHIVTITLLNSSYLTNNSYTCSSSQPLIPSHEVQALPTLASGTQLLACGIHAY